MRACFAIARIRVLSRTCRTTNLTSWADLETSTSNGRTRPSCRRTISRSRIPPQCLASWVMTPVSVVVHKSSSVPKPLRCVEIWAIVCGCIFYRPNPSKFTNKDIYTTCIFRRSTISDPWLNPTHSKMSDPLPTQSTPRVNQTHWQLWY